MYQIFASAAASTQNVGSANPGRRTKRHQVARACVWCRTYRIKCDSSYPCRNCKLKGRDCTTEYGKKDVRTFSSAMKEIDRLQERVKELENELQNLGVKLETSNRSKVLKVEPRIKIEQDVLPEELDPLAQHGANRNYYNWSLALREARPGSNQAYGSSSIYYFMDRLCRYINTVTGPWGSQLESPSLALTACWNVPKVSLNTLDYPYGSENEGLSRLEETRLIALYWELIHPLHPVLDQNSFGAQYKSFRDMNNNSDKFSSLLDIMLAVSMQVKGSLAVSKHDTTSSNHVTSAAGQRLYRRCQTSLQEQLEEPTVVTFQCYYLSVLWLSRASLYNAAYSALAAGLRIGVILGLHVEPPQNLSPSLRQFRKQLWWTMYSLEAQYAMDFGRPLAVNFGQVTCTPLQDTASQQKSSDNPSRSFNSQYVRLILAARSIYILFYRECAQVLREHNLMDLYQKTESLEACATWLNTKKIYLDAWIRQVPAELRAAREGLAQPYSTERSKIALSLHASNSTLSQGLLLELLYHALAMNIYRPFITFPGSEYTQYPATEYHATSCVEHALEIISIIHQALVNDLASSFLPELCTKVWNAALTIVGYIIAYPGSSLSHIARESANTAIECLDSLGHNLVTARTTKLLLLHLLQKADSVSWETNLNKSFDWEDVEVSEVTQFDDITNNAMYLLQGVLNQPSSLGGFSNLGAMDGLEDDLNSEEWLNQLLDFDANPEE